ncbi:MAG: surface-adhesin E family protein [Syntrophorhabdales bacterium]
MTTTHTVSVLPSRSQKGLVKLTVILASLFLVSCSHPPVMNKNDTTDSQKKPEAAQKAREAEPQPGDTRVIGGVEYVYGKNVRYMVSSSEPEYVWVRRDQYSPGSLDSSRSRTGTPTKEQQELAERIARLEEQLKTGGASQPVSPGQPVSTPPVSDEAGRQWMSYMEDAHGVEYFYDKDTIAHPSKDLVQMWRKREFSSGASQKEIVALDEIDCRGARYRSLELRVTDRDGAIRTFDKATSWVKVYVDSAEEYLMDKYCK